MKRVLGILAGACLALLIGCAQSYDLRVEETIKNMKYRQSLDKNTEAPPAKSNLEKEKIYLRAPKGLKGPAQTFALRHRAGQVRHRGHLHRPGEAGQPAYPGPLQCAQAGGGQEGPQPRRRGRPAPAAGRPG